MQIFALRHHLNIERIASSSSVLTAVYFVHANWCPSSVAFSQNLDKF